MNFLVGLPGNQNKIMTRRKKVHRLAGTGKTSRVMSFNHSEGGQKFGSFAVFWETMQAVHVFTKFQWKIFKLSCCCCCFLYCSFALLYADCKNKREDAYCAQNELFCRFLPDIKRDCARTCKTCKYPDFQLNTQWHISSLKRTRSRTWPAVNWVNL